LNDSLPDEHPEHHAEPSVAAALAERSTLQRVPADSVDDHVDRWYHFFESRGFGLVHNSASLVPRGFKCQPAGLARQFLLPQELFDPAGDLFSVRLERKMTRVE
jgi:hypothetical protein